MTEALNQAAPAAHHAAGGPLVLFLLIAAFLLGVATMAFRGFLEYAAQTLMFAAIGGIASTLLTHQVLHLRLFAIGAGTGAVLGAIGAWRWARWLRNWRQRSSAYPFIGGE
jgi:hypothetical protein